METKSNLPTAVIVGMENNGLGVARALSMAGIPAIGLAGPYWTPSCKTNACKVIYNSSWTREGVISDLKSIGRSLDQKAPLIITKDEPVLWISESRNEIADFYEMNLPEHCVVELLMNKSSFQELGVKEGWPLPITWQIGNRDELMAHLNDIAYPCIVKPRMKNSEFRRNTDKKAFIVRDERELLGIYDVVGQWEQEVVIQEWIEGGDDRIAYCLTYYNRQGEPEVHFPGRKLRQHPIRCGNTAIAEPAPKEWAESIIALSDRIFHKAGFRGIGSVEYKMRPDTMTPVIMEPTVGRTNYQNEVAVINGVNIPAIAYGDLTNQDYRFTLPSTRPVKLVDGRGERKAAFDYWRAGELGLLRWMKDRKGKKKYMVFRASDPGPFIASLTVAAWTLFRRCARILLKPDLVLLHFKRKKQARPAS